MTVLDPSRLVGAPISWGVSEVPGWGVQLPPERVLAEMRGLGLEATELGPDGYLPRDPEELAALLESHGLRLVGGFVPAVLHRPERWAAELALVEATARQLAAAGAGVLVLAAAAAAEGYEGRAALDETEWRALAQAVARVEEIAAAAGLRTALHPHLGTVVERREDVERVLAETAVPLCLDTGHLLAGGSDPVELAAEHAGRIAHAHLKDVDAGLAARLRDGEIGYRDAVVAGLYRPLGEGDVAVGAVVDALERSGYDGVYVLEQDAVLRDTPRAGRGPILDVRRSMHYLQGSAGGPAPGARRAG